MVGIGALFGLAALIVAGSTVTGYITAPVQSEAQHAAAIEALVAQGNRQRAGENRLQIDDLWTDNGRARDAREAIRLGLAEIRHDLDTLEGWRRTHDAEFHELHPRAGR